MNRSIGVAAVLASLFALACSESTGGSKPDGGAGGTDIGKEGKELTVKNVPEAPERVFVDLAAATKLEPSPANDGMSSTDWDLAFGGLNVFTNSGISGPGQGASFGPLSSETFLDDFAPTVPFLDPDTAGGAFFRWWAYDGNEHVLYSRFHVYGIKDETGQLYKVQVLGFYAEVMGAPVTAIYSIRWANVTQTAVGVTNQLDNVDGTAGGKDPKPDAANACLDLAGTGKIVMHTPAEEVDAKDWHLCFRRDFISINGGVGGVRGVTAVDLSADKTDSETLAEVVARTPASELPAFDAVDYAALTAPGLDYEPDQPFSAFTNRWLKKGGGAPQPEDEVWFVIGADGVSKYMIAFEPFEKGTEGKTPGTVHARVKVVQ